MTSQSNPFVMRAQQRQQGIESTPKQNQPQQENPFAKRAKEREPEEDAATSTFRYASQIPFGLAQGTTIGILSGIANLMAYGDVNDPEELDRIKAIAEREGIPFDEEKFKEAAQNAMQYAPTISNAQRVLEESTGLPVTAKTKGQKALNLAATAYKGIETANPEVATSQKVLAGVLAPSTKQVLEEQGVPEFIAEPIALGTSGLAGHRGVPKIDIGKSTKPSGLVKRGFEGIKQPREVSTSKMGKINDKLELDFKGISNDIIQDSPVGDTARALSQNPTFKQESRELLSQAQEISDTLPARIASKDVKKEIADLGSKKQTGYASNEYDKSYNKFVKEMIDDISDQPITAGQLVQQYRKNNASLSEYFEPGASKALNRAKRDAILDHNRAIANVLQKQFPDSELVPVFKEGNERWTKIMDAEAVDDFITEMFDGNVNYKKMHDFFDKENYGRIFKRALGEDGYKAFEQLMKDMMESESAYKMLRVAQDKGFSELVSVSTHYLIHPKLGATKVALSAAKKGWKLLMNSMLDKPQIAIKWRDAVKDLKKGDFKKAEKEFKALQGEIEIDQPKTKETKQPETVYITPKKPESQKLLPEKKSPKLIEHKPTKAQIAKKRINDGKFLSKAFNGESLTKSQSNSLKDLQVSLTETRGKGQQYHGSTSKIQKLNSEYPGNPQNIYGDGFYTTDALDIAEGYSKSNKKNQTKNPTIYTISEKSPQNIYNAEQDISDFKKMWDKSQLNALKYYKEKHGNNTNSDLSKKYSNITESEWLNARVNEISEVLIDDNPKSVRELYDKLRDKDISVSEVHELFDQIRSILEKNGYQGISHKGGLFTNNKEHEVKIYWNPENIEIKELKYPKNFSKIKKIKPS